MEAVLVVRELDIVPRVSGGDQQRGRHHGVGIIPTVPVSRTIAGVAAGAVIGSVLAARIQMTAMPQLVAALHSFVGMAAVLVAIGTFINKQAAGTLQVQDLEEIDKWLEQRRTPEEIIAEEEARQSAGQD